MEHTEPKPTGRKVIRLLLWADWPGGWKRLPEGDLSPGCVCHLWRRAAGERTPVSYCRCVGLSGCCWCSGSVCGRTWPPFRTSSCWPAAVSVKISWPSQERWGHLLVQADFLPPHVPPALIPPRFCCGGPLLLHEGVGGPPGTLWPGRNSEVSPALSEVTAAAGEICCKQPPPSSQPVNDQKICLFNVQQNKMIWCWSFDPFLPLSSCRPPTRRIYLWSRSGWGVSSWMRVSGILVWTLRCCHKVQISSSLNVSGTASV